MPSFSSSRTRGDRSYASYVVAAAASSSSSSELRLLHVSRVTLTRGREFPDTTFAIPSRSPSNPEQCQAELPPSSFRSNFFQLFATFRSPRARARDKHTRALLLTSRFLTARRMKLWIQKTGFIRRSIICSSNHRALSRKELFPRVLSSIKRKPANYASDAPISRAPRRTPGIATRVPQMQRTVTPIGRRVLCTDAAPTCAVHFVVFAATHACKLSGRFSAFARWLAIAKRRSRFSLSLSLFCPMYVCMKNISRAHRGDFSWRPAAFAALNWFCVVCAEAGESLGSPKSRATCTTDVSAKRVVPPRRDGEFAN